MANPMTAATLLAGMTLAASSTDPGWTPQTELDCHPYLEMVAQLKQTYGQVPIGGGVLHDASDPDAGGVVIAATPKGESWTLVVLTRDGRQACIGAFGHAWQQSMTGRRGLPILPPDGKPRVD